MKILRLDLKAFGPFTDLVLDLSAGAQGLHIIYGPNEAGKSTALRALEQLFFGMPERSGDEFLHTSPNLRLGALLQHSDGARLEFWRRRARKNPLFAADDKTPLESRELARHLGNIDQGFFTSMFGLNRAALEKAGQEMLRGDGQLGQILFAAGSGIAGLRAIQGNLQEELDELFKPTGKNQRINKALLELRDTRERLKKAQLPSEEWAKHDSAWQHAEKERRDLQSQQDELLREERRLTRLRDALPVLARRRELLAQAEQLRNVPQMAEDFSERRRQAQADLGSAVWKAQQSQKSLNEIQRQLADLQVPETLLAEADAIEDLHRRLGEYQKSLRDLPESQGRKLRLEQEVGEISRRLGQGGNQSDLLRVRPEELAQPRKLALDHPGLEANLKNSQALAERLAKQLQETRAGLAKLPPAVDVAELRQVVRQTQRQGPLDEEWAGACQRADLAEKQTARLVAQIPGYREGSQLLRLPVPSLDSIDRFQIELQDAQARCQELEKEIRAAESDLESLTGRLAQLELHQQIPTEGDLEKLRRLRTRGWQLVRRAWLEGTEDPQAAGEFLRETQAANLAEGFERTVREADLLADRLRREADRVAQKAQLLAQQEQRRQQQTRLTQELAAAKSQRQMVEENWRQVLEPLGIGNLLPREMRAWLGKFQAAFQQDLKTQEFRDHADSLHGRLLQFRKQLETCLGNNSSGESRTLAYLLEIGQQILDRQDALARNRQDLDRDLAAKQEELDQARSELGKAREALTHWQSHWARAMQKLGLEPDTDVAVAHAQLDSLQQLFLKLKEDDDLRARIESLNREIAAYITDVENVRLRISSTFPADASADPAQTVVNLHRTLSQARIAYQRRTALQDNCQILQPELEHAQEARGQADKIIEELCRLANCANIDDLPAIEEQARVRKNVERDLDQLNQHLLGLRAGASLEEFSAQVAKVDADRLEADLARLGQRQEALGRQLQEVDQTIGRERQVLGAMDGSAAAVECAEQAELLQAKVQSDAQEYLLRRLAMGILQASIESHRQKNEGQVLREASEYFKILTNGAFEGLNLDTNDQDETVLSGVRGGDRQVVPLEGMSDGTRDQLFLALRLASLDGYLQTHEPIPFIVDDLLLNFDDTRARAALQALAQLSRRTQVIFFTHHRHLLQLAQEALPAEGLFIHQLPGPKPGN